MKVRIKKIVPISWLMKGIIPNPDQLALPIEDLYYYKTFLKIWKIFILGNVYKYINYITNPFSDAVKASIDKLNSPDLDDNITDAGIMVAANCVNIYVFQNNKFLVLSLTKNGELISCSKDNYVNSRITIINLENKKTINNSFIDQITGSIRHILLFIKYAQIEKIDLQTQEKKKLEGHQYYNDSDSRITVYNCKWFTEITRSEGFSVRGHFRLQPYKETKKLIYIESFEKHGYHRKPLKPPI